MEAQELKRSYDEQGFVVVPSLLTPAEFSELQNELDRYIHDVVPTLPSSDAFYDGARSDPSRLKQLHRMDHDPFFAAYREHPAWKSLAELLVGEQVSSSSPEWFNKPPRSKDGTPPHQDNYYFCLEPCNVVTIWMALDVVDDENACLRYVPGSHQHGVRRHSQSEVLGFSQGIRDYSEIERASEMAVHLRPGEVVAHHGNTIHRAEPNLAATRHRRAFAMVFRGESCRRDDVAFARYQAEMQQQQKSLAV